MSFSRPEYYEFQSIAKFYGREPLGFQTLPLRARAENEFVEEGSDITIRETPHIPFMSNGIPEDPAPVIIDVVTLDYLPKYLELAKLEFNELEGKL